MPDTCNEPRNHIRFAAKLSMALPPFSLEATLIIPSHLNRALVTLILMNLLKRYKRVLLEKICSVEKTGYY